MLELTFLTMLVHLKLDYVNCAASLSAGQCTVQLVQAWQVGEVRGCLYYRGHRSGSGHWQPEGCPCRRCTLCTGHWCCQHGMCFGLANCRGPRLARERPTWYCHIHLNSRHSGCCMRKAFWSVHHLDSMSLQQCRWPRWWDQVTRSSLRSATMGRWALPMGDTQLPCDGQSQDEDLVLDGNRCSMSDWGM